MGDRKALELDIDIGVLDRLGEFGVNRFRVAAQEAFEREFGVGVRPADYEWEQTKDNIAVVRLINDGN